MNQQNGQHPTGPKTTAGEANSSPSYQHGMFAQHLLRPSPQGEKDREAYDSLARRAWEHYQPEGFLEGFMVEKIVTEMVRYARIIGHEQRSLGYRGGPLHLGIETVLRFSNSSERQLMRSIRELERIQQARLSNAPEDSAAERSGRSRQARQGELNWVCLGSIFDGTKPADGEAKTRDSSHANAEAKPTGPTSSDQNPGPTTAPSVSGFMRAVNESVGLPSDFPSDRKSQTNPSAADEGPVAEKEMKPASKNGGK